MIQKIVTSGRREAQEVHAPAKFHRREKEGLAKIGEAVE
jgi:hypothetical protein